MTSQPRKPKSEHLPSYHFESMKIYNVYVRAVIFPQRLIVSDANPHTLLELNSTCKKVQ
jgi:hypothetical protein